MIWKLLSMVFRKEVKNGQEKYIIPSTDLELAQMMFAHTHDTCWGCKQSLCEVIYYNVLPWLRKKCTGHYSTDRQIDGQVIPIYP